MEHILCVDGFAGCCGAFIISEFPSVGYIELIEAEVNLLSEYPSKRIYMILDTKYQVNILKYVLKHGWKKAGKSWKNQDTKNTLQLLTYYKPARRPKE